MCFLCQKDDILDAIYETEPKKKASAIKLALASLPATADLCSNGRLIYETLLDAQYENSRQL